MEKPRGLIGQSNLTKRDICEVVMHTVEPVSTQEATEEMVKILEITYAKTELKQAANNTNHLNSE